MAEHWSERAMDWIMLDLAAWPYKVAEGRNLAIRILCVMFMLPWVVICGPVIIVVGFPLMFIRIIHELGDKS